MLELRKRIDEGGFTVDMSRHYDMKDPVTNKPICRYVFGHNKEVTVEELGWFRGHQVPEAVLDKEAVVKRPVAGGHIVLKTGAGKTAAVVFDIINAYLNDNHLRPRHRPVKGIFTTQASLVIASPNLVKQIEGEFTKFAPQFEAAIEQKKAREAKQKMDEAFDYATMFASSGFDSDCEEVEEDDISSPSSAGPSRPETPSVVEETPPTPADPKGKGKRPIEAEPKTKAKAKRTRGTAPKSRYVHILRNKTEYAAMTVEDWQNAAVVIMPWTLVTAMHKSTKVPPTTVKGKTVAEYGQEHGVTTPRYHEKKHASLLLERHRQLLAEHVACGTLHPSDISAISPVLLSFETLVVDEVHELSDKPDSFEATFLSCLDDRVRWGITATPALGGFGDMNFLFPNDDLRCEALATLVTTRSAKSRLKDVLATTPTPSDPVLLFHNVEFEAFKLAVIRCDAVPPKPDISHVVHTVKLTELERRIVDIVARGATIADRIRTLSYHNDVDNANLQLDADGATKVLRTAEELRVHLLGSIDKKRDDIARSLLESRNGLSDILTLLGVESSADEKMALTADQRKSVKDCEVAVATWESKLADIEKEAAYFHSVLNDIGKKMEETECPICYGAQVSHITKCGHLFCGNCIQGWLSRYDNCPQCRIKLPKRLEDLAAVNLEPEPEPEPELMEEEEEDAGPTDVDRFGSKCAAFLAFARDRLAQGRMIPVYTASNSHRKLLAKACQDSGVPCKVFHGNLYARSKMINMMNKELANANEACVIIMSMEVDIAGMNLVGVNECVFFHASQSVAMYKQGIGRVWRNGQTRHCYIHHFVVADSSEQVVFDNMSAMLKDEYVSEGGTFEVLAH